MGLTEVIILLLAGLGTGFLVGLLGVGGGIIFVPVLLYYYKSIGIDSALVAELTVATSLFCVLLAATSGTRHQLRRKSAVLRTAIGTGVTSGVAVILAARFITTQPWFDAKAFQLVFAAILVMSVLRMAWFALRKSEPPAVGDPPPVSFPAQAATGAAAGTLSAVAGVGGGIILVPIYHDVFRYPIHLATGTSSATIVLTSLIGVLTYVIMGWGVETPSFWSAGYVDVVAGLVLAVPSFFSSKLGVAAAHRMDRRWLTLIFVALALTIAAQMALDSLLQ